MRLKRKHIEIAVYVARPAVLAAWWQKSAYYKRGFVVRLLWLGFVLRLQGREPAEAKLLVDKYNDRRTRALIRLLDSLPDTDGYDPELADWDALVDMESFH